MKSKDQIILEKAYINIYENKENWIDRPDSEGFWWFYGDATYGAVRNRGPDIKLSIIETRMTSNSILVGIYKGGFFELKPYKKPVGEDIQKEGYFGKWQKIIEPQPPDLPLDSI